MAEVSTSNYHRHHRHHRHRHHHHHRHHHLGISTPRQHRRHLLHAPLRIEHLGTPYASNGGAYVHVIPHPASSFAKRWTPLKIGPPPARRFCRPTPPIHAG